MKGGVQCGMTKGLQVSPSPPPSPHPLISSDDVVDMQAAGVAGVGTGACAIAVVACS